MVCLLVYASGLNVVGWQDSSVFTCRLCLDPTVAAFTLSLDSYNTLTGSLLVGLPTTTHCFSFRYSLLRESGTRLKPSVKGTMHRMFVREYILLYNNILANKIVNTQQRKMHPKTLKTNEPKLFLKERLYTVT